MSLAQQIALLTNPTPVFDDPEDDQDKDTKAKVVDFVDEDEEVEEDGHRKEEPSVRSSLRARTAALLHEGDNRYAGKKISRKELMEEEGDESDSDEKDSVGSGNEEEEEDGSDDAIDQFENQLGTYNIMTSHLKEIKPEGGWFEVEEGQEISEEEEEDEEEEGERQNVEGPNEEKVAEEMRHFAEMHLDEDAKKGNAIKSQLQLWDSLLESRIKLQKVMLVANQLPQYDTWNTFCEKGGRDFNFVIEETRKKVENLLERLVQLQDVLLARNPETEFIVNAENGAVASEPSKHDNSDEEIPSDTEDEEEEGTDRHHNVGGKEQQPRNKRKLKPDEYPEYLKKRHRSFQQFRDATIEKWNERTKLTTGKLKKSFVGFEQSALKQIEQILSDKERLIKRTQMKRNAYVVLGKTRTTFREVPLESGSKESQEEEEDRMLAENEYDEEIFDDNDFYHQLLRDLIERRTVNITDPVALGRQWLEIQKLRSKMKRKVDTRASKGRKIRYDVHSKLVNFMAPMETFIITDEAKNELYNSLFGKSTR